MRVLVTGALGFLGQRLCRILHAEGIDFVGTSSRTAPESAHRIVTLADSLDDAAYASLISDERVDVVVNTLAAGVDPTERSIPRIAHANAMFPALLATTAHRAGAKLFVQIGSSAEYAPPRDPLPICETEPLMQAQLYGASKAAGGLLLGGAAKQCGVAYAVLRLFNIYGPGEKSHRLFPWLISRIGSREPVPLSAGTQTRDFLFVDDACRAIVKFLRAYEPVGGEGHVFNLASGRPTQVREFALAIAEALEADARMLNFGALPLRPDDLPFVVADVRRIEDLIGSVYETPVAKAVHIR